MAYTPQRNNYVTNNTITQGESRAQSRSLSLSLYTPHPAQQSPSIGSEGKKLPPPFSLTQKTKKSTIRYIHISLARTFPPYSSLCLSPSLSLSLHLHIRCAQHQLYKAARYNLSLGAPFSCLPGLINLQRRSSGSRDGKYIPGGGSSSIAGQRREVSESERESLLRCSLDIARALRACLIYFDRH